MAAKEEGVGQLRGGGGVVDGVGDVLEAVLQGFGLVFDLLLEVLEAVLEAVLELLALLFEFVLEVLDGVFELVEGLLGLDFDVLVGPEDGIDLVVEGVEELLEQVVDGVGAVLEVLLQRVEGVSLAVLQRVELVVDGVAEVGDDVLVAGDGGLDGVEVRFEAGADEVVAALGHVTRRVDDLEQLVVEVLLHLDAAGDGVVGLLDGATLGFEHGTDRGVVLAHCTRTEATEGYKSYPSIPFGTTQIHSIPENSDSCRERPAAAGVGRGARLEGRPAARTRPLAVQSRPTRNPSRTRACPRRIVSLAVDLSTPSVPASSASVHARGTSK